MRSKYHWLSRKIFIHQYPKYCLLGSPFHRASNACHLPLRPLSCFSHLLHGLDEFPLRSGLGFRGAPFIQPSAILQFQSRVVAEEIRRTNSAISLGYGLRFVMEIGKRKFVRLGEGLHLLEGVFRVGDGIVGTDGHRLDTQGRQAVAGSNDAIDGSFYVGAVIADEHDEGAMFAAAIREGPSAPVRARQAEVRRLGVEIAERGLLSHAISLAGIYFKNITVFIRAFSAPKSTALRHSRQ